MKQQSDDARVRMIVGQTVRMTAPSGSSDVPTGVSPEPEPESDYDDSEAWERERWRRRHH